MFQPAGIVIVFQSLYLIGKSQSHIQLHLIGRLILTVTALSLAAPVLYGSQCVFSGDFPHIVCNTIFVEILSFGKSAVSFFFSVEEQQVRVDNCLPPQSVTEIIIWYFDLCKNVQIRQPVSSCASLLLLGRLLLQSAYIDTLFEMQVVLKAVTNDLYVHVRGSELCGTKSQTVQSQRIRVVVIIGVVFTACIEFTVDQFPVIAVLVFIEIYRTASAEVFHFNGIVLIACHDDLAAVSGTCFIDRVGNDFKNRMGTAVQSVRAKNDTGAFSYLVWSFEHRDTFIIIRLLFRHVRSFLPEKFRLFQRFFCMKKFPLVVHYFYHTTKLTENQAFSEILKESA